MIYLVWGDRFLPNENAIHGIAVGPLGEQMGLIDGDKILAVGQHEIDQFGPSEVIRYIITDEIKSLTIERGGKTIDLELPAEMAKTLTKYENKDLSLYNARIPTVIGQIAPGYAADKAGIEVDDQIIAINGQQTLYYDQYVKVAKALPNKTIDVSVLRGSDTLSFSTTLDSLGRLGIYNYPMIHFFDTEHTQYTFVDAMSSGWTRSMGFYKEQFKAFGKMFTGGLEVKESVGGPVMIATMFKGPDPNRWNWQHFWNLTAMLSLILAFMNMLPIPALDGGHVMFLIYEVLTGRKPSDKVVEYATLVGFVLIMGLMVFIVGNDISRLFR